MGFERKTIFSDEHFGISSNGAGDRNRTDVSGLEGLCSTTELRPRIKMVGREGFEPSKCKHNRFTVCPLWPLGYLPNLNFQWSWRKELNLQPADYKSAALPIELRQHYFFFNERFSAFGIYSIISEATRQF